MVDISLAAAIVVHNNHVLIVRRSMSESFLPGIWGVPCGKIDEGEDPQAAVLRELQEETGLIGEVVGFVGKVEFDSIWNGQPARNVQSNFLVRLGGDGRRGDPVQVKLPMKDQKFKWVPLRDIDREGLDDHNMQVIRQGLAAGFSAARTASSRS